MNFTIVYIIISLIPAASLLASKIWDKVKYLSLLTIAPAVYLIFESAVRNYNILLLWLWSAPSSPLWQRLLVPLLLPEVQASVAAFIISIFGLKRPKLLLLATIIMLPAAFNWVAEVNGVKIFSLSSVKGGGFQSLGTVLRSPWLIWEFLALIVATLGLIAPILESRKLLILTPLALFTLIIYNLYARGTTLETTSRDFAMYLAFISFMFQNPYAMPFVSAVLEGLTRLNLNIGEYTWPFRGVATAYFLTWSALGALGFLRFRKRDPLYLIALSFYAFMIAKSTLALMGISKTVDATPFYLATLAYVAYELYREVGKISAIPLVSLSHPIASLLASFVPLVKRNYKAVIYSLIIASTLYGTALALITPYAHERPVFEPVVRSKVVAERYNGKLAAVIVEGYTNVSGTIYNVTYIRGITSTRALSALTAWATPAIKGLEVCGLRIVGNALTEFCYPLGTLFIFIPLISYLLWRELWARGRYQSRSSGPAS